MRAVMSPRLVAYWFRTRHLGYGVTAFSLDEARALLREHGYPREGEEILETVVDVRHAHLDQDHVVTNAGPIVMRGVWYPRLNL